MSITDYVAGRQALLGATPFVTTTSLSYEERPPSARHLPTFPHHKHVPAGLLAAEQPSLEQVLQEIVSQLKFL